MGSCPSDCCYEQPELAPVQPQPSPLPSPPLPGYQYRSESVPTSPMPEREKETIFWPLPPKITGDVFRFPWPIDPNRYTLPKMFDGKSASKYNSGSTAPYEVTDQKQAKSSHKWKTQNLSVHDAAHVHSTFNSQSHSLTNLSTVDEINVLMVNLSKMQSDLDGKIKDKVEKVSQETENIIQRIINDTHEIQQRLLQYGERRQMTYDKLYREWLQKYVSALDEWQSSELASLNAELNEYRKNIMAYSQARIAAVNNEATHLKLRLITDEQQNATCHVDNLMAEIDSLSNNRGLQNLGSEKTTEINLLIKANTGSRAPNQGPRTNPNPSNNRTNKPNTNNGIQHSSKITYNDL